MKKLRMRIPNLPYAQEEAMNRLRINMKFCGKNTRIILITSSMPDEGKSTVAVQLWRMLAEAGFPTIFVDVDLRKSVLKNRHQYRFREDFKGMDYYLSGLAEYEDVIYETNIKNGYVIPCASHLENPSVLLEDPRMAELLSRLSQEYRYVIVDSPPLNSVSDGALLASYADGAILVVRSGQTSRRAVKDSLQQLERVHCRLLGTVLNRVEVKSRAYGKYYGKYGQYYYQYGDKQEDRKK